MSSTTAPSRPGSRSDGALGAEIRLDPSPKRIRVYIDGSVVGDSIAAVLAYATGHHPQYLLPDSDIEWSDLDVDTASQHDVLGSYRSVRARSGSAEIGRSYVAGHAAGSTAFVFEAMDSWFEEDEQIWFHPRDPFRRVEVIESGRHVEITVNGAVLVCSDRPRLVTETGLPARWYVPRAHVDWAKLRPSATTSGCQYKGLAAWWHVQTDDADQLGDVVWGYERPIVEASKLAGLVAFYGEHAAVETWVDGVRQPKPVLDATALNPSLGLVNIRV